MSSADRRRAPRFVSVSGSAVFGGGGAVTVLIACGGDGEVKAEDRHARHISSNADSRDRDRGMVDMLTVIVASRRIPTRAINTISAIIMAVRIWCWFLCSAAFVASTAGADGGSGIHSIDRPVRWSRATVQSRRQQAGRHTRAPARFSCFCLF